MPALRALSLITNILHSIVGANGHASAFMSGDNDASNMSGWSAPVANSTLATVTANNHSTMVGKDAASQANVSIFHNFSSSNAISYLQNHIGEGTSIYEAPSNNTFSSPNNSSLNMEDGNEMLHTIEVIGNILSFYYVPILVGTGSIGNILSVFVFFNTKLRKLSSSVYLSALAVSDTCFLLGLLAQWLNFVDVHIYNREYFCQFFTFFSSLACFCSVWFVVAFTVERFIAVLYPLQRQTMCTVRRAKIVLTALTILGCVHCAPFWISSTPVYSPRLEMTICDIKTEYKDYITLLNYWDTIVVFAVPFTIIVILNTITGFTVWKFANVRRTLTAPKMHTPKSRRDAHAATSSCMYRMQSLKRKKPTTSESSGQNHISQENSDMPRKSGKRKMGHSSQLKVTKMLLIVSTVFVCLNLPSCVMRMKTYVETQTATNEKTTIVLQYIFQLLFITNFGINFVLYCVSGQNFRKEVAALFRRVSMAHREGGGGGGGGGTQVTVSEYYRNSAAAGAPTRRRIITQSNWNEILELHPLK